MDTMDDVINQVHALEARVAELERYVLLAQRREEDRSFVLTGGERMERAAAEFASSPALAALIKRIGELAMSHGHEWADADAEEALTTLERLDAQLNALKPAPPKKLYYFGVRPKPAGPGHFWCTPDGSAGPPFISVVGFAPRGEPAPEATLHAVDGRFAPYERAGVEALDGVGRVTFLRGMTILAWWDSSGDRRPGSNSALVAYGRFSFEEMVEAGRAQYPWVFERMGKPLRDDHLSSGFAG